MKFLDNFYAFVIKQAKHRYASYVLFFISFAESSFFPLPPDPLLSVMVSLKKDKAIFYCIICSLASVLGGILGYAIGYYLFDAIGNSILETYNLTEKFYYIAEKINKCAFWFIVAKGLTPIPYKVVTIAAGALKTDLLVFLLASIISRSLRFIIVCTVSKKYGEQILNAIEKHKTVACVSIFIIIILIFTIMKVMY